MKNTKKRLVKTIALTRTRTTYQICVPMKAVKDMQLEDETDVWIEYDYNTKVLTIKKIGS